MPDANENYFVSTYITDFNSLEMISVSEVNTQMNTRVVQKVLQMLGFHRYKRLMLAKFVMLE